MPARLVHGIAATFGIEAFVWLTDVAGLSREAAVETIRSNGRAILQSALADLRSRAVAEALSERLGD